jgi:hypothetical protein
MLNSAEMSYLLTLPAAAAAECRRLKGAVVVCGPVAPGAAVRLQNDGRCRGPRPNTVPNRF